MDTIDDAIIAPLPQTVIIIIFIVMIFVVNI